jgi:hypothetical protein
MGSDWQCALVHVGGCTVVRFLAVAPGERNSSRSRPGRHPVEPFSCSQLERQQELEEIHMQRTQVVEFAMVSDPFLHAAADDNLFACS